MTISYGRLIPRTEPEDKVGRADRSVAEIPHEQGGTRTRDLSAQAARTVLTDWVTTAEPFDVASALLILDGPFAGHCSLPRWEPLLVKKLPGTAAFIDLRASLVVPAEAIIEVIRVADVEAARCSAAKDVHPVGHECERHPFGWR